MKKNILQSIVCCVLVATISFTVMGCSGTIEPGDQNSQSQQNEQGQQNSQNQQSGSQLADDNTSGKLYAGGVSRNLMENVVSGNVVGKETHGEVGHCKIKSEIYTCIFQGCNKWLKGNFLFQKNAINMSRDKGQS